MTSSDLKIQNLEIYIYIYIDLYHTYLPFSMTWVDGVLGPVRARELPIKKATLTDLKKVDGGLTDGVKSGTQGTHRSRFPW